MEKDMITDEILIKAVEKKASDLHITVGVPCIVRVNGKLLPLDEQIVTPNDSKQIVKDITNEVQQECLEETGEVDFSYSIAGLQRFRVNAYKQRNTYSIAFRLINTVIPTMQELGLPPVVQELALRNSGLILVTGITGSGKSTTLASMVNYINMTRDRHIITLEDPIEFLFRHNKSIIEQREIGMDSMSFKNALRASLRQDPDVILVGEMRDFETISIALTAAETGHLVLSTLHTNSAASTIDRIIDVFPSQQQQQVRIQLAMTIQGIISQKLVKTANQMGRVAAVEVMLGNTAVRNLIREGKGHQINSFIQTNASSGMRLMDDALCELFRRGQITRETALEHCTDLTYMRTLI